MEHQQSHLKTVVGFLGITDIRIVRAEGLAMGNVAKAAALAAAAPHIVAQTAANATMPAAVAACAPTVQTLAASDRHG